VTTEHTTPTAGWATPAERQAAARDAYLAGIKAGEPPTTAELAQRFSRSTRWAQQRIAEARQQHPLSSNGHSERQTSRSAPDEPAAPGTAGNAAGATPAANQLRPDARAQRIDTLIVAIVALVAAVASYQHQRNVALLAGEHDLAYVLPLSVDGMMLATSRSILRRRRNDQPVPAISWFGFLLGFIASVAANVAAAQPTVIGRLVAAWPPIALFIAYETLAADHHESAL
jgi:hypothetical protein